MEIPELLKYSIIFFLPAYVANAMPVVVAGLKIFPSLAKPIHAKWLGTSKTYRGFIFGIAGALLIGFFQNTLLLSLTLGVGALLGDLIKSFFKRLIGIKSGNPWPPFDQLDYVIGALLFSSFILSQSTEVIITLLIISPLFSITANITAYLLKIKKVWW